METQMLLLEAGEESAVLDEEPSADPAAENKFYILLLPVLEGPFRSSLQGTSSNELQFCVESGKFSFFKHHNMLKLLLLSFLHCNYSNSFQNLLI